MTVDLSIIIVHFGNPSMLQLCLESIFKSKINNTYEIIVVDSQSSRYAKDVVLSFGNGRLVRYLPFRNNIGFPAGVNEGIRQAQGTYFLITNHDIIFTPKCIQNMLDYSQLHPDIGLLGPKLLNFNEMPQQSYFKFYRPFTIVARRVNYLEFLPFVKKHLDLFLMKKESPEKIIAPDWLMGSVLLTSRDAVSRVGLMDERFFMYFEDVDWARRFWQRKLLVVYYPRAVAYHYYGKGSASKRGMIDIFLNYKTRWHVTSAIKYFLKYRKRLINYA